MHRLGRQLAILAGLAGAGLAQPPGAPPRPARTQFDTAAVDRGRKTFQSSCGFCHGNDATGNRAPDLIRSVTLGHDVDGDRLGPVIRNGRPDQGMPGFPSLSAAQIADITVFLHYQADMALHSNAVPRDYPLSKLLTGNAEAGKTYFNGAGGCAGCHSPTGDLKGIAGKYAPLELEIRSLHPQSRQPIAAKLTLADGKVVEGTLANQDDFNIGIIGRDGWYHSWPKSQVKVELKDPLAAHKALLEKLTDAEMHNVFAYLETLK